MKEIMKKAVAPVRSLYDKASAKTLALSTAASVGAMTLVNSAFAAGEVDAVFDVIDVSSLQTRVTTLVTALVLISVVFVAYKYGRRVLGMA